LALDPVRQRAVVVVNPDIRHADLERLHLAGVRSVCWNIVDVKEGKGKLPLDMLNALALKVQPFGWHLEFLMHVDVFPGLDRLLDRLVKGLMPNDGPLTDLLAAWVADVETRRRVLVDNPARLYGFPAS